MMAGPASCRAGPRRTAHWAPLAVRPDPSLEPARDAGRRGSDVGPDTGIVSALDEVADRADVPHEEGE